MEAFHRVAAWATVRIATNDYILTARSYISDYISDDVIKMMATLTEHYITHSLELPPVGLGVSELVDYATETGLELTAEAGLVEAELDSLAEPEGVTSVEIGGPEVDAEIAEIRRQQDEQEKRLADQAAPAVPDPAMQDPTVAALQDKQAKEQADLDKQLADKRDRLDARLADKPEDVRTSLMESFNEAARDARGELAAQHAQELREVKGQESPTSPTSPKDAGKSLTETFNEVAQESPNQR